MRFFRSNSLVIILILTLSKVALATNGSNSDSLLRDIEIRETSAPIGDDVSVEISNPTPSPSLFNRMTASCYRRLNELSALLPFPASFYGQCAGTVYSMVLWVAADQRVGLFGIASLFSLVTSVIDLVPNFIRFVEINDWDSLESTDDLIFFNNIARYLSYTGACLSMLDGVEAGAFYLAGGQNLRSLHLASQGVALSAVVVCGQIAYGRDLEKKRQTYLENGSSPNRTLSP